MVEITEITLESGVNAWDSTCEHPRRVTGRLRSTRMLRRGQYLNLGSCHSLIRYNLHGRATVTEMDRATKNGQDVEYTGSFVIDQTRLHVDISNRNYPAGIDARSARNTGGESWAYEAYCESCRAVIDG